MQGLSRNICRSWTFLRPAICIRRANMAKASASRRSKHPDPQDEASMKAKILEETIKQLNDDYGKGHVMMLGQQDTKKVETTSSGALTLDIALGGGYPRGRVIEIFGPESAGKTSLALHAMIEVQKTGGEVLFVDVEHAVDMDYAQQLGLDVDKLLFCQPACGEEALETVDRMARTGAVSMICVDSVSALLPKSEIQGEIGASQVGVQARMMSQALRRIVESASKYNCTVIFVNQIRFKIGVLYGSPETTSGGNALKFYCSIRLDVRKGELLGSDKDNPTGIKIKCRVVKNKVAPPFKRAEIDFLFGSGIDKIGCILDAAEKVGLITRKGSYYYKGEIKLGQGRDKSIAFLKENTKLLEEIALEVQNSMHESSPEPSTDEESNSDESLGVVQPISMQNISDQAVMSPGNS